MNDEVKAKVCETFSRSRLAVYRDEKNQKAFLRAAAGVLRVVQCAPVYDHLHPDWPKLKTGQRFDSPKTNASKVIVSNLIGSWVKVFGRIPSGKKNSVFFNVINDLLTSLDQETLGEAALKSMMPRN